MAKEGITARSEDYSQWYQDIIQTAELAENGPVRGTIIIKPYGFAIWEAIQRELDSRLKGLGVKNAYFPMLIPESLLRREAQHIEGFSPEVAVVTFAGGRDLDEKLVLRPTSETIIYEAFARGVQSYRDLPMLINQWVNVIRWELRPRLFLRGTEFLWQEGHTAHETLEEADEFARLILKTYKNFFEEYLSIPVIEGQKPEWERFAGAHTTYTVEAMMQDGRALQIGTSHNLGQNFSRAFEITFLDREQNRQYVWQTSWGVSTRSIGGLVMTHSDDVGLVLPPKVAPIKVVVTILGEVTDDLKTKGRELVNIFKANGLSTEIDERAIRPGNKFYEWERKGIPVRIEIGAKELKKGEVVLFRRDTKERMNLPLDDNLVAHVKNLLESIQLNLLNSAKKRLKDNTVEPGTIDEFKSALASGKFTLIPFCGDFEAAQVIKNETQATLRCIPFDQNSQPNTRCLFSGKSAKYLALFAKAY